MPDLAHQNVDAATAMKLNVGGGEVPEGASDSEFEERIRGASLAITADGSGEGYSSFADATARVILEAYEEYPQLRDLSGEPDYLKGKNGRVDWSNPIALNVTLGNVIDKLHPKGSQVHDQILAELTGFQWGWAVNAARKILGLGPVPNPALWEFRVKGEISNDD